MRFIGNVIWLIFGGIVEALLWFVVGLVLCLTIIGLPFGVQCMKIAGFVLWPFGREVIPGGFGVMGALANVLWIVLVGWALALMSLATGVLFCITIIGIPFGMQHFKLAKLALFPFGAQIVRV
ncbi:MAG: YccF domain-containing protein [Oscillospiraceae bacterium]|nr:YccF domain-containing protein [Oscillospiraceae bacterium]